ncbi:MAG: peptide deformylase [Magnetospirillum sp. WYHS-4]
MALLEILVAPDPRLKKKAARVDKVDAGVRRLMDDMMETMHEAHGIGLAAPQVAVSKRVIVLDVAREGEDPMPLYMANPEIVWASDDLSTREEGCLSLPEQFAEVTRPARIRVRYLDHDNVERELEAEGILSVCLQHEMDHLEGTLFVDRISMLKRSMIMRRLTKARKGSAAGVL